MQGLTKFEAGLDEPEQVQLLRTIYNEEIRPRLHPGQQSEMKQMLEWLATAVADNTIGMTLRETLHDNYRRTADQDSDNEEDADEDSSKPNPTPLMLALNPLNFTPGCANWPLVERILDNEDWESTLAWTWPYNLQGPSGYSAIHLAANKQDKAAKDAEQKQFGTPLQIRCLERIFAGAIKQGCINYKFGVAGGTILHMAVASSNLAVLNALKEASDTLVGTLGAQLADDWHPDWTTLNNDGLSPLGFFIFKYALHEPGQHLRELSTKILDVLREGLRSVGWSGEEIQSHERDMTDRVRHLKRERAEHTAPPPSKTQRHHLAPPRRVTTPPRHSTPRRPFTPGRSPPPPPPPPAGPEQEDRQRSPPSRRREGKGSGRGGDERRREGKGSGRRADERQQWQWSRG